MALSKPCACISVVTRGSTCIDSAYISSSVFELMSASDSMTSMRALSAESLALASADDDEEDDEDDEAEDDRADDDGAADDVEEEDEESDREKEANGENTAAIVDEDASLPTASGPMRRPRADSSSSRVSGVNTCARAYKQAHARKHTYMRQRNPWQTRHGPPNE